MATTRRGAAAKRSLKSPFGACVADMYTKMASSMDWKKPPTSYYLSDVREKVLWRDPATGAEMVLMK